MKKFKGTQGKWHTVEKNRVIYVENKDQVLVAELDNYKTLGFNQATPIAVYFNAKLMAAAPCLLDALQETEKDLCVLWGQMIDIEKTNPKADGLSNLIDRWRKRNKEAINKALN
jgi:hypothetical protein